MTFYLLRCRGCHYYAQTFCLTVTTAEHVATWQRCCGTAPVEIIRCEPGAIDRVVAIVAGPPPPLGPNMLPPRDRLEYAPTALIPGGARDLVLRLPPVSLRGLRAGDRCPRCGVALRLLLDGPFCPNGCDATSTPAGGQLA